MVSRSIHLTNKDEIPEGYTRVPPDGGWAWVVLFGCCFAGVPTITVSATFGVILNDLTALFSTTTATLSWVSSVSVSTGMFLGPFYTIIINTYGCRKAVLFGGILTAFGIIMCYFVYSVELFILTYGFIAGMGAGLSQGAYPVVLSHYFKKYYGVANGCLVSSFAVSRLVLTPVEQLVLNEYGCRSSFLIMGANVLHICIGACLLQPAKWHSVLVPLTTDTSKQISKNGKIESLTKTDEGEHEKSVALLTSESPVKDKLLANNNSDSISASKCHILEENEKTVQLLGQFTASVENMDIICSDVILNSEEKPSKSKSSCFHWCRKVPLKAIDHSVWKEPLFYIICVNGSLILAVMLYSQLFLFPLGVEIGLTPMQTASVISGKAIADILGRLFGPALITIMKLPTTLSYIVLNVIGSIILAVIYLAKSYEVFVALSVLYGIISGVVIGLNGVLLVECMGAKRLSSVIGLSSFVKGFFMMPMAPIMGWIRDVTGSFKNIFMFLSVLQFLLAILWALKPLIVKLGR